MLDQDQIEHFAANKRINFSNSYIGIRELDIILRVLQLTGEVTIEGVAGTVPLMTLGAQLCEMAKGSVSTQQDNSDKVLVNECGPLGGMQTKLRDPLPDYLK